MKKLNLNSNSNQSISLEILDELLKIDVNELLILYSDGINFCTGLDIKTKDNLTEEYLDKYILTIEKLKRHKVPIISLINNNCLGGGMLFPLLSDIVIATEQSKFGFPEIRHGFLPGLVSLAISKDKLNKMFINKLIYTGDSINSKIALDNGLITEISNNLEERLEFYLTRLNKINISYIKKIPFDNFIDAKETMLSIFDIKYNKEIINNLVMFEDYGDYCMIKFNNPTKFNSLNINITNELLVIVRHIKQNDKYKCVILYGEGEHFCVGGDFSSFKYDQLELDILKTYYPILLLKDYKIPLICICHGKLIGGGLAISQNCDIKIATNDAQFNIGWITRGVTSGMNLAYNLKEKNHTLQHYLLNTFINANDAKDQGLIDIICNNVNECIDVSKRIAKFIIENNNNMIINTISQLRNNLNTNVLFYEIFDQTSIDIKNIKVKNINNECKILSTILDYKNENHNISKYNNITLEYGIFLHAELNIYNKQYDDEINKNGCGLTAIGYLNDKKYLIIDKGGLWNQKEIKYDIGDKRIFELPYFISDNLIFDYFNMLTSYVLFKHINNTEYIIQTNALSSVGRGIIYYCNMNNIKTINIVRNKEDINELNKLGGTINLSFDMIDDNLNDLVRFKPRIMFDNHGGKKIEKLLQILDNDGECYVYGNMSKQLTNYSTKLLLFKGLKIIGFWLANDKIFINLNKHEFNNSLINYNYPHRSIYKLDVIENAIEKFNLKDRNDVILYYFNNKNRDININKPKINNIGIKHMEVYIPKYTTTQKDMEIYDNQINKYTKGLKQDAIGYVDENEDVVSMCLTVVNNLMHKYNIPWNKIGRLEVGTESSVDRSKSVKTFLMRLFNEHGIYDIEGIDTYNACYGGTSALLNTINWIQSDVGKLDNRYGLVVTADICSLPNDKLFFGGAAAVAMLITSDAPIVFDNIRSSCFTDKYDFYKPIASINPYPIVQDKHSIDCYIDSLKICADSFKKKTGIKELTSHYDYIIFHSPNSNMAYKGIKTLLEHDFGNIPEVTVRNIYTKKVEPSLYLTKNIGSTYTASVHLNLYSLLSMNNLKNKKILLYSYGSGSASTLWSINLVDNILIECPLERINNRIIKTPIEYKEIASRHDNAFGKSNFIPTILDVQPNTYYLVKVDENKCRYYDMPIKENINIIIKDTIIVDNVYFEEKKEDKNIINHEVKKNIVDKSNVFVSNENIKEILEKILKDMFDEKIFDWDKPLLESGFDSLSAVEFHDKLQIKLGTTISETLVFDYPTLNEVCDYLSKTLEINNDIVEKTNIVEIKNEGQIEWLNELNMTKKELYDIVKIKDGEIIIDTTKYQQLNTKTKITLFTKLNNNKLEEMKIQLKKLNKDFISYKNDKLMFYSENFD